MTVAARVDWDRFQDLPGSAPTNFEALCRALVRLHYGRFGIFRATAQMPGIEFHLKLNVDCALGKTGDWFGWQCRWYRLGRGKSLNTTQRAKILKAVRTTEKTMPDLTDWVLWTRYPLTAGDDKWFNQIKSKFRLHSRDSSYAEELLSGNALIFRATYFGEWVLRPESLADRHQHSVSSIRARWLHEAHQEVEAERTLRRILGEASSWTELLEVAEQLEVSAQEMRAGLQPPQKFAVRTQTFITELENLAVTLRAAPRLLAQGDFDLLQQTLEESPKPLAEELSALPRQLRALRLSINFHAANGFFFHRQGRLLIEDMHRCQDIKLHAVMADAGGGKTQLAAELTAPLEGRPAGILLHGRDLKSGDNLNDLAGTFVLDGKSMPTFEALLASLDAAGQRARRRLPLVVDGLNEAEDPRDWKKPLNEAGVLLGKFPHVLLIVTLRTGGRRPSGDWWYSREVHQVETEDERTAFARIALPEETPLVEMNGFGGHTWEAIDRYFRHFRINALGSDIPEDLLSHPLTLRIFCEVANPPPQKREVGPEALPRSLMQLFEIYVARSVERIGVLSPKAMPYSGHDVRRALNQLGSQLWEKNSREIDQDTYRDLIGDSSRIWDHSLVKMMEQEGLILRVAKTASGKYGIVPVYDAIGGYIITNALLAEMGRSEFVTWVQSPSTLARFRSNVSGEVHQMASDIFKALVALTPRRFQQEQLWNLLSGPLQREALVGAIDLESDLIDRATVDAIAAMVCDPTNFQVIVPRLRRTRAIPQHSFNAIFLDVQLRQMPNAERDLLWSEMIRKDYERNYRGFSPIGEDWAATRCRRSEIESLRARWTMWLLTSSARDIRIKVTRALYWFGRGDPQALFTLALESLSISDPYVAERMLAACYGVVMDRHGKFRDPAYETTVLKDFARALYDQMFSLHAPHSTTHVLLREYACRIIEVAHKLNKTLLTAVEAKRTHSPFPKDLHRILPKVEVKGFVRAALPRSLDFDFPNYTLGRLIPDRSNYDFDHPEYRDVVMQIVGRIRELGWTPEAFSAVDQSIDSDSYRRQRDRSSIRRIDSYGEKYCWIAYYEQVGMRIDLGLIKPSHRHNSDRSSEVDIDPSFPESPKEERLTPQDWLASTHKTLPAWIARGPVPDTTPLLHRKTIFNEKGPWLMLDGYITQQDKVSGRELFCFIRTFLIQKKDRSAIVGALKKQSMHGRWPPEKPQEIYVYAGEFPWCSTLDADYATTLRFVTERKMVTVMRRRPAPGNVVTIEAIDEAIELLRQRKSLAREVVDSITQRGRSGLVPTQEVREKATEFKATIPVCDFCWAGSTIDDMSASGVFLAKPVAQALDLRWIPGTHDLADIQGRRATGNTHFGVERNQQQAFFVRKDLFVEYLRQTKQALVWVSWGERQITHHWADHVRDNREKFGPPYKVFHTVKTLSPA
ncbi:hypothetical protein BH09VER1_BH09VER1_49610 [soil metagenome]